MRVLPLHSFDPLVVCWHALLAADLISFVFLLLSCCEQTPRDASEVKVTKGRSCGEKVFGNVAPFCPKIPAIFLLSFRVFCMHVCVRVCIAVILPELINVLLPSPFLPPSLPPMSLGDVAGTQAQGYLWSFSWRQGRWACTCKRIHIHVHIVLLWAYPHTQPYTSHYYYVRAVHTHRHMRYARLLTLNTI